MDMGGAYAKATRARAPQARQCVDPFHVVKLANNAIDKTRRAAGTRPGAPPAQPSRAADPVRPPPAAQLVKHTRWALLKDPATSPTTSSTTPRTAPHPSVLYRAGSSKKNYVTSTGSRQAAAPTPTSTGGWPGPAAPASPPSSPFTTIRATATGSSPPSNSACPTPSWRASTARSA